MVVPNVLSKEFVHRLWIEDDKTKRGITAVTGEKSPVVGMLKDVVVHLDEKVVNLIFLVVEGSPFDVIVEDPTTQTMEGFLDLGNRVSSSVVDGEKIEIPMEPDYVHEDPGYKAGTDTEDFTSATSARESEEGIQKGSDTTEEELILMINDECDWVKVA